MVAAAEPRRGKGHKKSKAERPKDVAEPVAVEPVARESSDEKPVEVDPQARSEDDKSGKEHGNDHGNDKGHDKKDKKDK